MTERDRVHLSEDAAQNIDKTRKLLTLLACASVVRDILRNMIDIGGQDAGREVESTKLPGGSRQDGGEQQGGNPKVGAKQKRLRGLNKTVTKPQRLEIDRLH